MPEKTVRLDLLANSVADWFGRLQAAAFEQHAKFVATQTGEHTALAQRLLHDLDQLPQQFIASLVSAGVIHHLELIEVEV